MRSLLILSALVALTGCASTSFINLVNTAGTSTTTNYYTAADIDYIAYTQEINNNKAMITSEQALRCQGGLLQNEVRKLSTVDCWGR